MRHVQREALIVIGRNKFKEERKNNNKKNSSVIIITEKYVLKIRIEKRDERRIK